MVLLLNVGGTGGGISSAGWRRHIAASRVLDRCIQSAVLSVRW